MNRSVIAVFRNIDRALRRVGFPALTPSERGIVQARAERYASSGDAPIDCYRVALGAVGVSLGALTFTALLSGCVALSDPCHDDCAKGPDGDACRAACDARPEPGGH